MNHKFKIFVGSLIFISAAGATSLYVNQQRMEQRANDLSTDLAALCVETGELSTIPGDEPDYTHPSEIPTSVQIAWAKRYFQTYDCPETEGALLLGTDLARLSQ